MNTDKIETLLDCGHAPDAGLPYGHNGQTGWTFALSLDRTRKLCAKCYREQVLDCGHTIGGEGPVVSGGYGKDADGKTHCYVCCGERDKAEMIKTGRACLYLSHTYGAARGTVGNWPGTLKLPCYVQTGRHNIAGKRFDVRFTGPDGKEWHGTQYGTNTQICHCKRTKSK